MNTKAKELLERIKALPQNPSTRSIKNGLRNVLQDCREVGHGSGGALQAAERYLAKHGAESIDDLAHFLANAIERMAIPNAEAILNTIETFERFTKTKIVIQPRK